jgi:hypothetical protein
VNLDTYYDSEQDLPLSASAQEGRLLMGLRLATLSDSALRKLAHDTRMSEAAHRAARHELERREKLTDPCPRGAGCADWTCKRTH